MRPLSLHFGRRFASAVVDVLRLAALAALFAGSTGSAAADELSKESLACLKCHDRPAFATKLADGATLSLHVSADGFGKSVHAALDCEVCHSQLDAATHGKGKTEIKSRRDLTVGMRESCRMCHEKDVKAYEDGVHAAMVAAGVDKAPVCADCHDPHTQRPVKEKVAMEATPCARCHKEIFAAYVGDVHGTQRALQGKAAPICADCHKAHAVTAPSLGTGMRETCLSCHQDAAAKHQGWLPNTARHLAAISCPACHAPDAKRRVNLRLFDAATNTQLREKSGVPQFRDLIAATGSQNMGLDERALRSLLKEFGEQDGQGKVVLQGRLEVRSGVEAHQLSDKAKALKDCRMCHSAGAEPFQSVTITMAGPDGRPLRHGVDKEVLTSLVSIESVRGFYAIGANRIKLLDVLLVVAVAGTLGGVLMHLAIRWGFRRAREKSEAARLADNDAKRVH